MKHKPDEKKNHILAPWSEISFNLSVLGDNPENCETIIKN